MRMRCILYKIDENYKNTYLGYDYFNMTTYFTPSSSAAFVFNSVEIAENYLRTHNLQLSIQTIYNERNIENELF
jgi:hypothetical protein